MTGPVIPSWVYLVSWISISCLMILLNKAILSIWNFGYPFFLTGWHMLFGMILTQVLARTTNLLPGVKEGRVTTHLYKTKILPISFCFAISLICGNKAYMFLSVSFIQMLKAFTPVSVLLLSFLGGLETPSVLQLLVVMLICLGVILSTVGELRFSLTGFILQCAGILSESLRLTLADKFLKDLKLDALSTLYYVAPPSFAFISIGFVIFESALFPFERLYSSFAWVLLINGCTAFALNIASVLLISHTSAMTLTIGGLFKDVMLVAFSVAFFSSPLSFLQIYGYAISLFGMNVYKDFKKDPAAMSTKVISIIRYLTFGRVKEGQLLFLRIKSAVNQIDEGKIEEAKGDSIDYTNDKVPTNRSDMQSNEQDPLLAFKSLDE
mmetsp:Transcript_6149/g.6314  ORF Transcript_6149/g.6314 Transcript_6149/m.6314 type:complete len:381 (-) Transcript_6149:410-1552(-)